MNVLLDSHVFLWLAQHPEKLSTKAANICRLVDNTLSLSMVSLWEIQIKVHLGKIDLTISLQETLHEQERINKIQLLPIQAHHIFALAQLPAHHRDPFDRLLVAQAISQNIPVLTHDAVFAQYPVQVIW